MKARMIATATLAAALVAIAVGAGAQNSPSDQSKKDDSTQSHAGPGMMGGGMMGQGQGMMGGQGQGMMMGQDGMTGQMQAHHQQMTALMNKLMDSMAAIQSEKDPEALKSKLAEHHKLLEEMRGQMMGQGNRMKMMGGQIQQNCPMTGGNAQPGAR